MPVDTCGQHGGHRKDGQPCGRLVIAGTRRCRLHAGTSPARARAKGNVVLEVRRWGLDDATVDPGETLLRLVSQSAARVQLYSGLLADAYAAADRIAALSREHDLAVTESTEDDAAALQVARADLERVFTTGGVGVLIGHRYSSSAAGIYPAGEQIRGLAQLEADERERCAKFAALAVGAGIAERQVRLAERQASTLVAVLAGVLDELGHQVGDERVRAAVARQIERVTGARPAIEGVAA